MNRTKSSNFSQGAFIATLGIVISKGLGILYVIPFYSLIGSQGVALYGYALSIYAVFLGFSEVGIPLAISKLTSEYISLNYLATKKRAFKIGAILLSIIGLLSFLILFFSSHSLATMIMENVSGGNSIEDISFVIKVVSTSILIVPLLSITRGYLQGHNYISSTSISQIVEQVIRVVIIIIGSFVALRLLNLSIRDTIAFSLFAGTISSFVALIYLFRIIHKNKEEMNGITVTIEPHISTKSILLKIIIYALPFVINDLGVSLFNLIDIKMLVEQLVNNYNYPVNMAEAIIGVVSTSGSKLNMITLSINTGILVSLIPSISRSITLNNYSDINHKINKSYQMILLVITPMVAGLSFLSYHVWTIFYGVNDALLFGGEAFRLYACIALTTAFFQLSISIIQLLKQYRTAIFVILSTIVLKVMLNPLLLFVFSKTILPTYYGAIVATIVSNLVPSLFALYYLHKNLAIDFKPTIKLFIKVIISVITMISVLYIVNIFWPIQTLSRFSSLVTVIVFAFIGGTTYFLISYKLKTLHLVLGQNIIDKIETLLRINKK